MKLLVLPDLHLEFGTFRVPEVEADAVIRDPLLAQTQPLANVRARMRKILQDHRPLFDRLADA
jgi:hypothetical protein